MKKIFILNVLNVFVLCAALSFPSVLLAQNAGFYAGVGLAQTRTNIENLTPDSLPIKDLINDKVIKITASKDSTDNNSWLIFGGFQFNRFFAIEASYTPIGEYTRRAQGTALSIGRPSRVANYETIDSLKLDGFGLAALASLPIAERFSIFGKFGVFNWSGKLNHVTSFRSAGSPQIDPVTSTDKDSGYSPMFGFGGRYDINRRIGLRAEWTLINSVGGNLSTGQSNVDLFSIIGLINF